MSGLAFAQLRLYVVRPVLEALGAHSPAAEDLVLGTAAQESGGRFLVQLGGGPARGLWQMEPATHDDIVENYLRYRPDMAARVMGFSALAGDRVDQLAWNLGYACAMCRVHYLRVPEALPGHGNVAGYARYWKLYYNTPQGRGSEAGFCENFKRYITTAGA